MRGTSEELAAYFERKDLPNFIDCLRAGADPINTIKGQWPLLHWASRDGLEDFLKEILSKNGKNINQSVSVGVNFLNGESDDWTPLMLAAGNGHLGSVKILLEGGASLTKTSLRKNFSVFTICEKQNRFNVLEYITPLLSTDDRVHYMQDLINKGTDSAKTICNMIARSAMDFPAFLVEEALRKGWWDLVSELHGKYEETESLKNQIAGMGYIHSSSGFVKSTALNDAASTALCMEKIKESAGRLLMNSEIMMLSDLWRKIKDGAASAEDLDECVRTIKEGVPSESPEDVLAGLKGNIPHANVGAALLCIGALESCGKTLISGFAKKRSNFRP